MAFDKRLVYWLVIVALLVLASFEAQFVQKHLRDHGIADIGTKDFVAYWTAFKLFIQQTNPYDLNLHHQEQIRLGYNLEEPQNLWNPPWALTLLSPILSFEFHLSATIWFILNISFVYSTSLLAAAVLEDTPPKRLACFLAGLFFVPTITTLVFGQLSLFIAFATMTAVWAIKKHRDFLAGFCLIVPTIKPHLVYLFVILLGVWIIRQKKWKILLSFLVSFSLLLVACYLQSPQAFVQWYHSQDTPLRLIPATSATIVRYLFQDEQGALPLWLVAVIPVVMALLTLIYAVKKESAFNWGRIIPPLLCLSLFTAPFGWMFDQALLLVVQVQLVHRCFTSRGTTNTKKVILVSLFLLQDLAALLALLVRDQHYYLWFPVALFVCWHLGMKLLDADENRSAARMVPIH